MTRPMGWLLAVSLLINVFAIGAMGGGLFVLARHAGWTPRTEAARHLPISAAGAQLPPAERIRFNQTMRRLVLANRALLRIARENRQTAADLFVEPEFDQAAVAASLARARHADFQLRTLLENAALDFAATLPADERGQLAAGLERGGPLRHPPRPGLPAPIGH